MNFTANGLNDKFQSWQYSLYQPVKVVINPVTIPYVVQLADAQTIQETFTGSNTSSTAIGFQTIFAQGQTVSLTSTATFAYTVGVAVSVTVSHTVGVKDINQYEGSVTTSFSFNYQKTVTKTQTNSTKITLTDQVTFQAPANTPSFAATVSISYGMLPQTPQTTSGIFYYKENLPGSTYDQDSGSYILPMDLTVVVNGGTCSTIEVDVSTS